MINTNCFNKILILGNGGSGKTSLANTLTKMLSFPILHLDKIYWTSKGWEKYTLTEFRKTVENFIEENPHWIIEGTPMPELNYRIQSADTIIFLDTNRMACVYRIIKRGLLRLFRDESNDGCPVKGLSFKTILWLWRFPSLKRPLIFEAIDQFKTGSVYYIENKNDLYKLIALIQQHQMSQHS